MTKLINFILNHTGKRWDEMQESTIRIQLSADKAIGQLAYTPIEQVQVFDIKDM